MLLWGCNRYNDFVDHEGPRITLEGDFMGEQITKRKIASTLDGLMKR